MSAAAELTNQIIDFVYRKGGYSWRASSVGIYDQQKRAYRTAAKKGVADILICFKGQLIAVEVKIGKDHLSLEQQGFLENIRAAGGEYFVASNFSEFSEWWTRKYS